MFNFRQKNRLYIFVFLLISNNIFSQKVSGYLQFEQGKTYTITITVADTITQQAGGRAIDFFAKGTAEHSYTAVQFPEGNIMLHHTMQRIISAFDGMNQSLSFDSDKDEGSFKGLLKAEFDVLIDKTGKILKADPEAIDSIKPDDSSPIANEMLQDVIDVAYPPAKNTNGFFKILPDHEVGINDTWADSVTTSNEKSLTEYTVVAITDSTIVIEFETNSSTTDTSQVMGRESKTNLKTITTGKIILDKATGIIKEKTSRSKSSGSKEVMGATLPITGKSATIIKVMVE